MNFNFQTYNGYLSPYYVLLFPGLTGNNTYKALKLFAHSFVYSIDYLYICLKQSEGAYMKKLILWLWLIIGFLAASPAHGEDLQKRKKNMDYQFVTAETRCTEIEDTFMGCRFGMPESEVLTALEQVKDLNITEKSYGCISTGTLFYQDFLFQSAQLLFKNNRFSNILFGSSFKNYKDALDVYLRIKQFLAEEYGPSLFKQKKENMANAYDLGGRNACLLSLTQKTDHSTGEVRFYLILNYWNKNLLN